MPRGMRYHNCIRCGAPVYGYKDKVCRDCLPKEKDLPSLNVREILRERKEQDRQGQR